MFRQLRPAVIAMLLFSAVLGLAYPAVITGLAQLLFPRQANGSLIERDGRLIGSSLLAQGFTQAGYFWSRPSATGPTPWNGAASSGSNLGPTNPAITQAVAARVSVLQDAETSLGVPATPAAQMPIDLVTSSGSGLDPHLSPAAARVQAKRVAAARGLPIEVVMELIDAHTEGRSFGFLGEPHVNVLALNLALDSRR